MTTIGFGTTCDPLTGYNCDCDVQSFTRTVDLNRQCASCVPGAISAFAHSTLTYGEPCYQSLGFDWSSTSVRYTINVTAASPSAATATMGQQSFVVLPPANGKLASSFDLLMTVNVLFGQVSVNVAPVCIIFVDIVDAPFL